MYFLFRNIEFIGVLHWYYFHKSNLKSLIEKKILIKIISKKKIKLIVHLELIKKKFSINNQASIFVLNYPLKYNKSIPSTTDQNTIHIIKKNRINVLMFGGTREDKGILDFIEIACKIRNEKLRFVLVGVIEHKFRTPLFEIKKKSNLEIVFFDRFVDDHEISTFFNLSDLVFLPYNSEFSGQSGPLLIAAQYIVPVVSSNNQYLKETIKKYQLGSQFSLNALVKYFDELTLVKIKRLKERMCHKKFLKDYNLKATINGLQGFIGNHK